MKYPWRDIDRNWFFGIHVWYEGYRLLTFRLDNCWELFVQRLLVLFLSRNTVFNFYFCQHPWQTSLVNCFISCTAKFQYEYILKYYQIFCPKILSLFKKVETSADNHAIDYCIPLSDNYYILLSGFFISLYLQKNIVGCISWAYSLNVILIDHLDSGKTC